MLTIAGREVAICDAALALLLEVGYDRMSMDASLAGPEPVEGFRAFKERRSPSWVPSALQVPGRL